VNQNKSSSTDFDSETEIRQEQKPLNVGSDEKPQYLWNVNDNDLPKVPQFHPIEQTAILVSHTSATVVAKRIANCLFHRSIESKFVSNREKVKAKCITLNNTEFRIRLYRPRKDAYSHGVIVEIQRRSGFDVNFNCDVQAIFDTAQGKETYPKACPGNIVQEDSEEVNESSEESSALLIAGSILEKSNSLDSHVMALKLVASLTDMTKVGKAKAAGLSSELFRGTFQNRTLILDTMLSTFTVERTNLGNSVFQEKNTTKRILALTILSNVFKCLSESDSNLHIRTVKGHVVPFIETCMQQYGFEPKTAFAYTKCLRALLEHDFGVMINKSAASSNLVLAKQIGENHHSGLWKNADECLRMIESR